MSISKLLQGHRLIPVITISDEAHALPLAEALLKGGIGVMEITLRHPAGAPSIARIRRDMPQMLVGAGTVVNGETLRQATDAGSQFIVSPGLTPLLAEAARGMGSKLLPGVATVSEAMRAMDDGFTALKLFPATVVGGIDLLKNIGSVLPGLRFCPTGGISEANINDFLKLPNVVAVGGSWLTPARLMQEQKWQEITAIAKRSVSALA
jgi:2-dehydro-3-deoxyphosphogluconate aldolase/(4S)-4-hydroxy-2-oxoglutarate aldolase